MCGRRINQLPEPGLWQRLISIVNISGMADIASMVTAAKMAAIIGMASLARLGNIAKFACLAIVILAIPASFAQTTYSSGGTIGLTINSVCGIGSSVHYFNVTNSSINSYYDFSFLLNNTGNVPVTIGARSFTNQGEDPIFQILASNYLPASCLNPTSGWNTLPNSTAPSMMLVCDLFNFTAGRNSMLINGSYFVFPEMFSINGTNNTKTESIRLAANYSESNQSCSYNETITLFFTGASGEEFGNFTVVIDGDMTTIMALAGMPITMSIMNATGGIAVRVIEKNSWLPLAMPQYTQSNVSNEAVGYITAGSNNTYPNFTIVPTGGSVFIDPKIGNYSARIELVSATGNVIATVYLNLTTRDLASDAVAATSNKNPPSRANIQAENNFIFRIYDAYTTYGGGPTYSLSIASDNSSSGFPSSVATAQPIALNLTAKYPNGTVISNATIEIIERNGYISWAMNQFTDSNVSNYARAYTATDSNGNVQFVITPTGGVIGQEQKIGNYSLSLVGRHPNGVAFFSKDFTVINRDYTQTPVFNGGTLPNKANLDAAILYVYRAYDRLNAWLMYGT